MRKGILATGVGAAAVLLAACGPLSYTPTASDWQLDIEVTREQCGSAGCDVAFQLKPTYYGGKLFIGTEYITFDVTGGDSGPLAGTIKVQGGGSYHVTQKEEMVSSASSDTKLQVKITDVSLRSSPS